jgi:hypothetical protein
MAGEVARSWESEGSGGGKWGVAEERRCTWVLRLVDSTGALSYDAGGKPLLRRCMGLKEEGRDVCARHGAQAFHERRELELSKGRVAQMLEILDLEESHPLDGLLDVVRASGRMVRLFEALVGELDTVPTQTIEIAMSPAGESLEYAVPSGLWGPDKDGEQAPHIYLTLYRQWLDMHAKHVKMCADAGIDERLVRNAEMTSASLFTALERALRSLDLEPSKVSELKRALGRELHELETSTRQVIEVEG